MDIKKVIPIGLLGIITGCSTVNSHEIIEYYKLEYQIERKPKILNLVNLLKNKQKINYETPYFDYGFNKDGHNFGVRFIKNEKNLPYFSIFADEIFIADYNTDGPDFFEIFDKSYNPSHGHIGNHVIYKIQLTIENKYLLNIFQDCALDIITSNLNNNITKKTMKKYEKLKNKILNF